MSYLSPSRIKSERQPTKHLLKARQFLEAGKFDLAEHHFSRAIAADTSSSAALMGLGEVYFKRNQPEQAHPYFARMTVLEPKNALAWRNLGVTSTATGNHQRAAEAFQQAIQLSPDYTNAHHGLALALLALDRPLEAIPYFQQVISRSPRDHEAMFNFANALVKIGEHNAAEAAYNVAISLNPDFVSAMINLGQLYFARGQTKLALAHLTKAVWLQPDSFQAHNNLGAAYQSERQFTQALTAYQTASVLQPSFAQAHGNIGSVQLALGNLTAAAESYRRALALEPNNAVLFSDLLFCLQSDEAVDNAALYAEHRKYAERFEMPLKCAWPKPPRPSANTTVAAGTSALTTDLATAVATAVATEVTNEYTNTVDAERRLRIGYVSGDLRNHAIAFFIEPTLAAHDRDHFDVFVYHNSAQFDDVSKRLSSLVDHWTSVWQMTDSALAQRIRDDGIDILIDLSGHTAHNRLLAFARKPAPVQTAWMGYGGTTGLDAMDYRITDAWHDPTGQTDPFNSETLIRLPSGNASFAFVKDAPAVGPLPALSRSGITLACLNSPRKIRPKVVALWSRILSARPDATLVLFNSSDETTQDNLIAQFAAQGISAARLIFQPWMALHDYLAFHGEIDLALDPFPYNGCTTSLHALWMGVPYVTLAGDRAVSRVGAGMLALAGLEDWITNDEDAYFSRVLTALADLPALNALRQALRPQLAVTEADRAAVFTRDLESALRQMWRDWCAAQAARV